MVPQSESEWARAGKYLPETAFLLLPNCLKIFLYQDAVFCTTLMQKRIDTIEKTPYTRNTLLYLFNPHFQLQFNYFMKNFQEFQLAIKYLCEQF